MRHSEFAIGRAFTSGHSLWRCTDIGPRMVVAIRIETAEVVAVLGGCETQSVVDPRRDPASRGMTDLNREFHRMLAEEDER